MLVPKLSAMSAACGPYIMSWKISETTIASRTSPPLRVLRSPKYGKAKAPVSTTPMPYMSRRPMRSETCPEERHADEPDRRGDQGVGQEVVALQLERAGPVGQDEGDEEVERRLLGHPHEGRGQDVAPLRAQGLDHGQLLDRVRLAHRRELRALQHPQPHVQPDPDQHDE